MKICIYSIAYNDENHIEDWYKSVNKADKIIVLDRGSTDNTVDLLKQKNVEVIEEKFSDLEEYKAKNYLLDYLKDFEGILLNIDLWEEIVKVNWNQLKINDVYNSSSIPVIFEISVQEKNKIYLEVKAHTSSSKVYWKYYFREECINLNKENLFETLPITIYKHEKDQLFNPSLINSRLFEDVSSRDIWSRLYFAEDSVKNQRNFSIAKDCLNTVLSNKNITIYEYVYAYYLKACLGDSNDILYLQVIISIAPWYRDPYIELIKYYINIGNKLDAYRLYLICKKNSVQIFSYIENKNYWTDDFLETLEKEIIN